MNEKINNEINERTKEILDYIGIEKSDMQKDISYRHWVKFISMLLRNDGQNWDNISHKMRSFVGVSPRYLSEYLDCLIAWEIVELNGNSIHLKGIPDSSNFEKDLANSHQENGVK